jgi:hypothetical protein
VDGRAGLGSSRLMLLSWFTQILLAFQTFRVIAVTDSAVRVFKSGWFTRYKPGQMLFSLPLNGAVQVTGRGGRFRVGSRS